MKRSTKLTNRWNLTVLFAIFTIALTASSISAEVCGKTELYSTGTAVGFISTFKPDTPQCKSAKEAFDSATVIVTGVPNYTFDTDSWKNAPNPYIWVNEMVRNPKYSAKFNEGLKFGDAVNFLKERIATNAVDRQFAIDNAFWEVYGRKSSPAEQAAWDSQVKGQKAWYATIVTSEIGKMNGNRANRESAINVTFYFTFGRTPTETELNYWKGRNEHFRLMMQANRNWLYSSEGANELAALVKKVLYLKGNKMPTDSQIKQKMTEYADKKAIFLEMSGQKLSAYK